MQLSRRRFLWGAGALTAMGGVSPLAIAGAPTASRSGRGVRGPTLVVVFLRGGADGLNLVVPYADPNYYRLRSFVAVRPPGERNGALDLDGSFGLHPMGAALHPLFENGSAVALHAVGHANNSRSHFREQDVWETAVVEDTVSADGWLNRHLATSTARGPVRAVAVGDSLPRMLRGDEQALALRGLADLAGAGPGGAAARAALEQAYDANASLAQSGRATLDALRILGEVAERDEPSKAEYPQTDLGRRMREVARLIRADIGLEIVGVDYPGWDTHRDQGGATGSFGNLVRGLSEALAAFVQDLDERMDDVLVVTLSEFGRTAFQNGTGGTDHGWGNCVLALGGPVQRAGGGRGRNVLGEWPGLARAELNQERDLRHTTEFRDVLGELVRGHLGNERTDVVLPGRALRKVGLLQA